MDGDQSTHFVFKVVEEGNELVERCKLAGSFWLLKNTKTGEFAEYISVSLLSQTRIDILLFDEGMN
jgi:hypothetical protein